MNRLRFCFLQGLLACLCAIPLQGESADAKNAILFIGDGMGLTQVTAARIFKGNARDGQLTLDTLKHTALVRTWCANNMVTDSAAAATALAAGVKTNTAVIGKDARGKDVESLLELAKKAGKSVGVVTTTTITHATPACFYAHVPLRADENNIAQQFVELGTPDLAFGGGRQFFLPATVADAERGEMGSRKDGRNLIEEAQAKGYRFIQKQSEFDALAAEIAEGREPGKILALFNHGMMNYEVERASDTWGEPTLAQMTALAIKILQRNPKGYFLMIEGGRIDHAAHANEAQKLVTDLIAFDDAIKTGLDLVEPANDTLVIITADHETGGLAINGYPPLQVKGLDMLSKAKGIGAAETLTFASGPGADRAKQEGVDRTLPGYKQPSLLLTNSAFHTGTDVIAWGAGPGADAIHGTLDNTDIPKIIRRTIGLLPFQP